MFAHRCKKDSTVGRFGRREWCRFRPKRTGAEAAADRCVSSGRRQCGRRRRARGRSRRRSVRRRRVAGRGRAARRPRGRRRTAPTVQGADGSLAACIAYPGERSAPLNVPPGVGFPGRLHLSEQCKEYVLFYDDPRHSPGTVEFARLRSYRTKRIARDRFPVSIPATERLVTCSGVEDYVHRSNTRDRKLRTVQDRCRGGRPCGGSRYPRTRPRHDGNPSRVNYARSH